MAQSQASSQLVCTWYNAAQTATVACPDNPAQQFSETVAAGAYSSTLSQSDANQQALNEANNLAAQARDDSGLCAGGGGGNDIFWNTEQVVEVLVACPSLQGPTRTVRVIVTVPAHTTAGSTQDEANVTARYIGTVRGNAYGNQKCQTGAFGVFSVTYGQ
jgi:hypothetical protein